METQRNKILNDLDTEYYQFIRDRVKALEHGFQNMKKPIGKQLKQDQKYGKSLIKLLHLWTQLKELDLKKEEAIVMKDITLFTYQPSAQKKQQSWSKHHTKQLQVGLQYVKLKKQIEKM